MPAAAVLDRTMDALANEHRREIVDRLSSGPMSTPALGRHFEFTKQALNRHLAKLEDAGLVQRHRRGRVDDLELVPDALDELTNWVSEIRRGWEANLDRLGGLFEEPGDKRRTGARP